MYLTKPWQGTQGDRIPRRAIGYSPAYLAENADGIRLDWPRIPLPAAREALEASAEMGRGLAALLDPETPVPGVTTGTIRPEPALLAVPAKVEGGSLDPNAGDLDLTAHWGYAGREGITMPGGGRTIEREPTPAERARLGEEPVLDVYLNDRAYWRCVPKAVWAYHIGGYQVVKKWLSYRERELLGRGLTPAEVHEVRDMMRRLAAIIWMGPELDASYRAVCGATYAWEP